MSSADLCFGDPGATAKIWQKTLKFVGPGYSTCCCWCFCRNSVLQFCLFATGFPAPLTCRLSVPHLFCSWSICTSLKIVCCGFLSLKVEVGRCLVPQYMSVVFFVASLVARQRTRCFLSAPSPWWHRKLQHTPFTHTHDISELLSTFLVVPCLSNMSIHDCQSWKSCFFQLMPSCTSQFPVNFPELRLFLVWIQPGECCP